MANLVLAVRGGGGATLGDVMRAKLSGEGAKKKAKGAKRPRTEEDWGDE